MAIKAWKRIEGTPGYQRRKLFFKRLLGRELWLRPEIDVHTICDGGWLYHPDVLDSGSIVYSLGIGKDIEFDLALIERFGLELHAYDPTPSTVEWISGVELPVGFHFHPCAVTAADGVLKFYPRVGRGGSKSSVMYTMIADDASIGDVIEVPAMSLTNVAAGHGDDHVDLLKMDIEGAEYDVIEHLVESTIRPRQLLVEFHHRFAGGGGVEKTTAAIAALRGVGYRLFSVSVTGRELSFLHDRDGLT